MSQKEYAEDTVFWSLKSPLQFSARRRTVTLHLANATHGPSSHTWIDNTAKVWSDLVSVLEKENPKRIAINGDTDLAFSSGLHAGEAKRIEHEIGEKWATRFVVVPMLGIEVVGTMPKGQLKYYKLMMESAWAFIEEAFSESVIVPGETTTEVGYHFLSTVEFQATNNSRTLNGGFATRSSSKITPLGFIRPWT